MPRADIYISGLFALGAGRTRVRSRVLTPLEATSLSNGLRADAGDFYYSSWVSFLDALRGINMEFYTWSMVKLYDCVFYAFRASLAANDLCAFYVDRSQYLVAARAGATPASSTDRGTHKAVMKGFQRQNPGHPLVSQQIDLQDAVDWLIEKRESANYGQARYTEPGCGTEFDYVLKNGLRQAINGYLTDLSFAYVFDPDHAMIAYPLRALGMVGDQLNAGGLVGVSEDEGRFLSSSARDRTGVLPALLAEMRHLGLVP